MLLAPIPKVETLPLTQSQVREWKHRVELVPDGRPDDEPILFRWHFPRGTLDQHMSALELTMFLMPHMPSLTPFIRDMAGEQAESEWIVMLNRLANTAPAILDDLVPWMRVQLVDDDFPLGQIRPSDHEPSTVVEMSLSMPLKQKPMGRSFVQCR